jgi:RimJ/RimL family protein N-acetyltransferase
MLQYYRREWYSEVAAFARRLPDFSYVDAILTARVGEYYPGHRYIWRAGGRIVATCTLAHLNSDDAWLHGMRVDPGYKNQGVATALTRQLLRVAARAGRTWVGLSTRHHSGTAPVFRIAEKLGMRLEGTYACDWYGKLSRRFPQPRLHRVASTYDHYRLLGEQGIFICDQGWYWARLLPGRRSCIDRFGFRLNGTQVHLVRHCHRAQGRQRYVSRTVNLYDWPADFGSFLAGLFSYAGGPRRGFVICYPSAWRGDLRRAARAVVPSLSPGRTCSLWVLRVYGRHLRASDGIAQIMNRKGSVR